jgi:hypothetical protein
LKQDNNLMLLAEDDAPDFGWICYVHAFAIHARSSRLLLSCGLWLHFWGLGEAKAVSSLFGCVLLWFTKNH